MDEKHESKKGEIDISNAVITIDLASKLVEGCKLMTISTSQRTYNMYTGANRNPDTEKWFTELCLSHDVVARKFLAVGPSQWVARPGDQ